jgi:N-acetylneuraminic acid mutarotase
MPGCSLFLRTTLPAIFLLASTSLHAGLWTQKADLGGNQRVNAAAFSIGNKGYIGTGFGCDSITCWDHNDLWEYDPQTDVWTQKADFGGQGRSRAVGFSIGSKGYIGLGYLASDMWEYDPASNTWVQKASYPGMGSDDAFAFSIGSKAYVGTGMYGSGYASDVWEFDPIANTWTQKASLFPTRTASVSFSIGSKGYVGTGFGPSQYKDFWEYDPLIDAWTQKANVGLYGFAYAAGFAINTKGYIAGGGYHSTDVWEWDQASNTWTLQPPFPGLGRNEAVAFSIGNKGYMGTGYDQHYFKLKDFWEFDPNSFSSVPENAAPNHASVFPNPFQTSATLLLTNEVQDATLCIYDVSGKELRSLTFSGRSVLLGKDGLPAGIYYFGITCKGLPVSSGHFIVF